MASRSDLADLQRGRDLIYFSEEILGVHLNLAQQRWFRNIAENGDWSCSGSVHVAANQVGKSLGVSILILWGSIYKIGVPNEDPQTWINAPYQWFHVAPTQQQAYIPLRDIELLVKGAHPAQGDRCKLPPGLVRFEKIEQYYDGFSTPFGAHVQFRTTEEKAKSLQGRRANAISFDEAAFETHLKSVINETLLMRLISTGGPLHVVSTPNGINDYYEIVEQIKDAGRVIEDQVWRTDDNWVLVWSTIYDNAGYGVTVESIERQERDLDPATKEQQLRGAFLEPAEAFFTPTGDILRAFRSDLGAVAPQPGRSYVIFWDPSVASDPTAAYVLDVTKKPWVVVEEVWERKPLGFTPLIDRITGLHYRWSTASDRMGRRSAAITGFDSTSMGGAIFREALSNLHPQRPLNLGGSTKTKPDVLGNLRGALTKGDLLIPDSMVGLKREILNYRLKDDKLQQDRVMALAGAAWIAAKGFSGVFSAPFSPTGRF